jgi:hypothetical protein
MCWSRLISNYLRANAYTDKALCNVIAKMKMLETFGGGLLGYM